MPESPLTVPASGHCLYWGRPDGGDPDGPDLRKALGGSGWRVALWMDTPGAVAPGEPFDLILVEDVSAAPADRIRGMKQGHTLAAGFLQGPLSADRLEPYDVIFCPIPGMIGALRGLGKPVHYLPSHAPDRVQRAWEIVERHLRYRRERLPAVDWARVSYGHAEIGRGQVSESMTKAWQSEDIPARQRALVQTELAELYRGRVPRVYQTLADALAPFACEGLPVLEIGCASGYYLEILEYLLNRRLAYEGADYSDALIRMARSYYPRATFHVADGAALPFADGRFQVAISSCVLLHVPAWKDHVRETARVASRAVIASRTPVCRRRPTQFQRKFAYGVETVELLFNEDEFLAAFREAGLNPIGVIDVGSSPEEDNYTLTYTFEKQASPAAARPAAHPAEPGRLEELLRRGEAAFAAGDLDGARDLFQAAAAIDADHPRVLNDLGVLALERGEPQMGVEWLRRAHARHPSDRKALENLATVLSALDRAEEALNILDRHLSGNPGDADMHELRESVLREAGLDVLRPPAPVAAPPPPPPRKVAGAWRNRPDMYDARGGDGTVVEETARWLREAGHRADINLEARPDLREYDLVHLNNITRSQDTLDHLRHARSLGKRAVLTPLFEDLDLYLREAWKVNLVFQHLAQKRQHLPLEEIKPVIDRFLLNGDPLADPVAQALGIGDKAKQAEILQGVDLILTSGRRESDNIRRKFGRTAPIEELHYGFNRDFRNGDPSLFRSKYGTRDFALCVGRIEPRKNQWLLIEAFRKLPHIRLFLVGQFSEVHMEPLIQAYAPPNVTFIPRLSLEELASAYSAARMHALASWYELPGLVSLEAAAAGCRIVTTDWGTSRDYFGDLAWYMPPDDPLRMQAAIREAWDSAPKAGLRDHVLESFSWEKTALAAADAYRRVLDKP